MNLLLALVLATSVLVLIPGPNVALIVAINAAPRMFWRGCMLAVVNPKTLMFNAAFIPQFVSDASAAQFALVAAVFLCVLFLGDIGWALFASSARRLLVRVGGWRNRITGVFLVAAGIGLALSRRT